MNGITKLQCASSLRHFIRAHNYIGHIKKRCFDTFSVSFKVWKFESKIVQHNGYYAYDIENSMCFFN